MIKQHYTGSSRRAMNIIWNAAGDYEWNSPFLAFHPNGDADDYMNLVIGLSAKWLDRERITDFFVRLGTGPTLDEASALFWLGIENCVYGKELPFRPHLCRMRQERAQEFFRINGMLSEQQMSFMSIRVYDQELLRWSKVLGRKVLSAGPGARKLSEELEFSPEWDTDEVLRRMEKILKETFRRTLPDHPGLSADKRRGLLRTLAGSISHRGEKKADLLVLRKGSGSGDAKRSVHITHSFGPERAPAGMPEDREYIEAAFGPCMYTDSEMEILERSLCTGDDISCRLWFTDESRKGRISSKRDGCEKERRYQLSSGPDAGRGKQGAGTEAGRLLRDQEKQRRRNEEYFRAHLFQIQEGIRNLSAQAEVIFRSYLRFDPARAKRGRLEGARAWRTGVLSDLKVFLQDADPEDAAVCVDLLLDASQSRMNSQEMIASQALVIARSFEQCHIPVRVTAFRTLRGYTILQRLKEYGDRSGEGIFRYYAGGWNRDALCLKAVEYLMEEERKKGSHMTRILLVLTDASPNDSTPLPRREGALLPREYEGDEPVRDAREAVCALAADGVYTGALFYGATSHLEQVHQIYGQQYVRIKTLRQLPDAVCELLRRGLSQAWTMQ